MKILADENVDRPIVNWLRELGHDVLEISVEMPGAKDAAVIDLSRRQNRVLMTFDRDVGRILLADARPHPGVIYLRLQGVGPQLWHVFRQLWPTIDPVAHGNFVTVRNHQVRKRPLP